MQASSLGNFDPSDTAQSPPIVRTAPVAQINIDKPTQ